MSLDFLKNVEEGYTEGEKEVHYYYNRDERIAKAPQCVKDFYDGKMKTPTGMRAIFAKTSNRYLFFSLVLFIAFAWVYTTMNNSRSYAKINEIGFDISSFSYKGEVFTTVKVNNKKANQKTPPQKIFIEVFYINSDNIIADKYDLSLIYDKGEKTLHTKTSDYDIIRVDSVIKIGDVEKEIFTSIKKIH